VRDLVGRALLEVEQHERLAIGLGHRVEGAHDELFGLGVTERIERCRRIRHLAVRIGHARVPRA
jgi:hypothetical protein